MPNRPISGLMTPDMTLGLKGVYQVIAITSDLNTTLIGDTFVIHVFGHLNPDSDTVCSAVVAAHWLTQNQRPAQAWRLGEANRETRFIFECAGLALPELLTMPLKGESVWMVDFNEPAQGPADLMESNIIGVTDHHRLGDLVTALPLELTIRPVGSTATLLWTMMDAEMRRELPASHATLLLGALLSDTIDLRSPTTTETDITVAGELALAAGVDRNAFAADLLRAKTDIDGLSAETLLNKDMKAFEIGGMKVRIAQIEVSSPDQVTPVMDELLNAMAALASSTASDLVVMMVTDIRESHSSLYFSGPKSSHFESTVVPGMLSRKKQMLPWMEARISALA